MKLYIAESHKEKGYFITAQKDGKNGSVQMYRGIFAIYDERSGRWHSKTQGGFTAKRDAKSWAEERYADLTEKGKTATIASVKGRTNFAAFIEKHYRDYLENDRQLKGAKQEFQKLDVLVEFFGNDRIEDIDLLRVKEFKKWLLARPYTRKDGGQEFFLSKTTSHRYLARLKHLLRYAADTLGTRVPPFRDLIKKSDEKPKGIKFTFDEFQRMLVACDRLFPRKPENRRRWRLVLVAAYTLGCRVDELYHITRAHIKYIDEENRVGLIELTMPDSRNKIHTKKMPITTWLFEEMEAAGIFHRAAHERLFMWTKAYRKPFDAIKEEAKVNPQGTFHTLRATSATDKAASGQEIETIQQEVGHRKGSVVTSRHYIHFEDRQILEAASSFNKRLEGLRRHDRVLEAEVLDDLL
ncbi:MAG: site-specific integrase [Acidobacteria bacterium]|nr:site-specific integrase [Acidobacteriota bacterium]